MTPASLIVGNGQENKPHQKLRILNLNQKQLIQNRIKKSRNRVLPSQQQNENNTYGPQIHNSKDEEVLGAMQRAANSKAATTSQK